MVGKAEEVYNILKEKIIKFELPPLSEISDDILKELNVSKTPLREAIFELEREGFIVVRSRKATVVAEVTNSLIDYVYEVRLLIEPFIAKTYYKNIDMESLQTVKRNLEGYNFEKDENRVYYIALDDELHNLISSACKNPFLYKVISSVNAHNMRIRQQTLLRKEDYLHVINQHLNIIEAIEQDNPEAIEAAVKYHILSGEMDAYQCLERNLYKTKTAKPKA